MLVYRHTSKPKKSSVTESTPEVRKCHTRGALSARQASLPTQQRQLLVSLHATRATTLLQHYIGGRSLAMAEITAADAKRMSCARLTKLKLFRLVEADRREPCAKCRPQIKRGMGSAAIAGKEWYGQPAEVSRRAGPPSPTLQPYPVCRTSLVVLTVGALIDLWQCLRGRARGRATRLRDAALEHDAPLVLRLPTTVRCAETPAVA